MEREAFLFYTGVMIGLLGNLCASVTIEMTKAIWEKNGLLWYWATSFIITSIIFFQLVKWAMRRLGITQRESRLFDLTTIVFVFIGIFVIVGFVL